MRHYIVRWVVWTLVFSVVPYLIIGMGIAVLGGVGVATNAAYQNASFLARLTGSGQMILTAIALVGGSLRELSAQRILGSGTKLHEQTRDLFNALGITFLVIQAGIYGIFFFVAQYTPTPLPNNFLGIYSVGSTVVGCVMAVSISLASLPRPEGAEQ